MISARGRAATRPLYVSRLPEPMRDAIPDTGAWLPPLERTAMLMTREEFGRLKVDEKFDYLYRCVIAAKRALLTNRRRRCSFCGNVWPE
jgi:hypothetical protein